MSAAWLWPPCPGKASSSCWSSGRRALPAERWDSLRQLAGPGRARLRVSRVALLRSVSEFDVVCRSQRVALTSSPFSWALDLPLVSFLLSSVFWFCATCNPRPYYNHLSYFPYSPVPQSRMSLVKYGVELNKLITLTASSKRGFSFPKMCL